MSIISNVTEVGTGVLGSQIAYQTAFHGYAVTAYDIRDEIRESQESLLLGSRSSTRRTASPVRRTARLIPH
jgi:3-hydroxyacyl-CoA dehydrogenase